MRYIALLLAIISLTSCTFSDKSDEKHDKAALPTLVLESARYVLGQQNESPIAINSGKIEFYSNDDLAIIENFTFEQKSENGDIIIVGNANKGTLNTYTKTMNLEGNVRLVKISDNMEINADSLFFDPDKEEVSANGYVMVKSNKGEFKGIGFFGDLKNQAYSFNSIEEGSMAL